MRPLDVYIVEEHNDALGWIYRQIGAKRLPVYGSVLLHLDSHPDLLLPADLHGEQTQQKRHLLDQLSIADWILPAVYSRHISDVIWLRPPWAAQLPAGTHPCRIGQTAQGLVRVDSPHPYFVSELLYVPTEQLSNVQQFNIVVLDFSAPELLEQLRARLTADSCPAYILDIDMDFFSTRNPFLEMYPKAGVYHRLQDIFFFDIEDGDDVEKLLGERREKMTEAKAVFDHLGCTGGTLEGYPGPVTPLVRSLDQLVTSIRLHYPDQLSSVDWALMYDAACTCDCSGLPHHVSSAEEVDNMLKQLQLLLSGLPVPGCVTLARSSLDNYCPPDQVEAIQAQLLSLLRRIYPSISIHPEYGTSCCG